MKLHQGGSATHRVTPSCLKLTYDFTFTKKRLEELFVYKNLQSTLFQYPKGSTSVADQKSSMRSICFLLKDIINYTDSYGGHHLAPVGCFGFLSGPCLVILEFVYPFRTKLFSLANWSNERFSFPFFLRANNCSPSYKFT